MLRRVAVLFFAYSLCASSAACNGPRDSGASVATRWHLEVRSVSRALFTARILLDDEVVYTSTATQTPHMVEFDRPYIRGAHLAEFEILSSTQSAGLYGASCWVILSPSAKVVSGEAAVTRLAIGERLVIVLSL